jgi:O-methyltransferase
MKIEDICRVAKEYTLLDVDRLRSLWELINDLNNRNVKGDIVECGSYKGGSSAVLRAGMGPQRKLWIYDSFQGLPQATEQDGDEAKKWAGGCVASPQDVLEILSVTGAISKEFIIKKGWFQETFKQTLPEQVAFLHCDADWYESTMLILETFYPKIPKDGCVVLDDFGHWEGCRMAFYDFCEKYRERPLLERVGYTQAFWIKGKQHNRTI